MCYKIRAALLLMVAVLLKIVCAQNEPCLTPDKLNGGCINLRKCPTILARLTSRNRQNSDINFVRQSTCGFEDIQGKEPKVCCPMSLIPARTSERQNNNAFGQPGINYVQQAGKIERKNSLAELLPNDCGTCLSRRILGGVKTELDEYPWLTLLEYRKPDGKISLSCGGTIISKRYVLTAAHCVIPSNLPRNWRLESVRLGEYNTAAEHDCIFDRHNNNRTCIEDPPLTVRIEKQIFHENFNPHSKDQRFDIALLRLAVEVKFTAYIKPICLPSHAEINQMLTVAGWGTTESRKESDVKLKVTVPLVDLRQCSAAYWQNGIIIGEGQMCAGGEKGKDSCRGDSGGPLMQEKRSVDGIPRWEAVGIVSFGPAPCGQIRLPGVYTKVYDYLPWIVSQLRL